MQLQAFILDNVDILVDDWAAFAATLPECQALSREALRDHAATMLRAIAADIASPQTVVKQLAKSRGLALRTGAADTQAEEHGSQRFEQGLGVNALVAEFRALRASVLRRWTAARGPASVEMLDELIRFNEGIDQAISESLARFVEELRRHDEHLLRQREQETLRLREHESMARQAEERLSAAMVEARMGFWAWDPNTDRISASPTMNDLLGLPPDEPLVSGAQRLSVMHVDDRAEQARLVGDAAVRAGGWRTQYRIVRPSDGQSAWLEERAMPAVDAQGRLGISGLTWDVTERKAAEQSLEEADRRKDQFLAMLAHELRNPLAPIRQSAAAALLSSNLSAEVRWGLEVIQRQSQKMALLLDDLLDVSRITRGRLQLRLAPIELGEVLRSAVETVAPMLKEGRHELQLRVPPAPLRLNGDALRLSQVVANLLTNAARYSEPGRPIELELRRVGEMAEIEVADHGIGIAADQLEAVFEMFGQGAAPSGLRQGGLGVGLALARGLVSLHGGSLQARSHGPGHGASFLARLPLAALADDVASHDAAPSLPPVEPARVLVIDDNTDAADSLAMLLRFGGHEVRIAYNGEDGLKLASAFYPDVVLLDLGMPGMDGYEVARRLRSAGSTRRPTLVALSGWGQASDRRRSADAGVDIHLTKPVDETELRAALASRPAFGMRDRGT